MEENSSVSKHILKMSGLHNRLSQLGVNLLDDAVVDRILQSLPPSYQSFVINYNMQGMVKTIPEVFSMLKSAEVEIKKEHQVLMVNKTTSFNKGKGKKKFNVRTPTQCHIDLACNTSYHFAASCTIFPRVSSYLCPGPFAPFGTRI